MKIEVIEGSVRLSSVLLSLDDPTVKIIDVEADTKYYHISSMMNWDDEGVAREIVELIPFTETLRADEELTNLTQIHFIFENNDEQWSIRHDEDARYSFELILRRFDENIPESQVIWDKRNK